MDLGMKTGCEGIRRKYDTSVFEKHELLNGVSIWLQRPPILVSETGVLKAVLNGVGAQADPPDEPGIAHFFEHMPFRGTEGRPSNLALEKPLTDVGGGIDAHTGLFTTDFEVIVPTGSFRLALETLHEVVAKPILDEEAVRIEQNAIINEYDKKMADSNLLRAKYFLGTVYPNSPWDHRPIGTIETIRGMTRAKLKDFHSRHFHAGNLEIVCGGTFSAEKNAIEMIADCFGTLREGTRFSAFASNDLSLRPTKRFNYSDKALGRDTLYEVFSLPPLSPRDTQVIICFNYILSKGMDSILIQGLRDKWGIVYESDLCYLEQVPGMQDFILYLPTRRENFEKAREIFREVLRALDSDYVISRQRARQLERKKSFEEATRACLSISGELFFLGRPLSYSELEEMQDSITVEEILQWRDYLLESDSIVIEMTT